MKKILSMALAAALLLSLAACGNESTTQTPNTNTPPANSAGDAATTPAGDTAESTEGTRDETATAGNILVAYFSFPMDGGGLADHANPGPQHGVLD